MESRLPNRPTVWRARSLRWLREEIRSGRYQVDSHSLAKRMIESLLEEARPELRTQVQLAFASVHAPPSEIVGNSLAITAVLDALLLVAPSDAPVLVQGETGTGKELVAQVLHRLSPRGQGPFVLVSCAELSEGLLESELFGHAPLAYTGDTQLRLGRFREASQGTLFLDQIGEMPPGLQLKLLNALIEKKVRPVGSMEKHPVDVRVIAANDRSLREQVAEKRFHAGLLRQLDSVSLWLPPLRERAGDVALLAEHFLRLRGDARSFTPSALGWLRKHSWPGNVRELENLVERLTVLKPIGDLDAADLRAFAHDVDRPTRP